MRVFKTTAIADDFCAMRFQVCGLLKRDLSAQFNQHIQLIHRLRNRLGDKYVGVPRQRGGNRHIGGVEQTHAVFERRCHQNLGQKQCILFDTIDPQAFIWGV